MTDPLGRPTSHDVAEINRFIGKRITEARRLAGLTKSELAAAIGVDRYQIMGLESGIDVEGGAAPWIIQRIAAACVVKGDFLLGLTEESEPDAPGPTYYEVARICNGMAARARERYVVDIATRDAHLIEFRRLAADVDAVAQAVQAALERVAELNPEWEDMKAGARLASSVEALHDAVGLLGRRSSHYIRKEILEDVPDTPSAVEHLGNWPPEAE